MSEVFNIIDEVVKRDSLGRRRHPNQNHKKGGRFRGYGEGLTNHIMLRLSDPMKAEIALSAAKDKTTIAAKIREYIEWGLENEE